MKAKTYYVEFFFDNAGLKHTWIRNFYTNNLQESIDGYLEKKKFPFNIEKENIKYKPLKYGRK